MADEISPILVDSGTQKTEKNLIKIDSGKT